MLFSKDRINILSTNKSQLRTLSEKLNYSIKLQEWNLFTSDIFNHPFSNKKREREREKESFRKLPSDATEPVRSSETVLRSRKRVNHYYFRVVISRAGIPLLADHSCVQLHLRPPWKHRDRFTAVISLCRCCNSLLPIDSSRESHRGTIAHSRVAGVYPCDSNKISTTKCCCPHPIE